MHFDLMSHNDLSFWHEILHFQMRWFNLCSKYEISAKLLLDKATRWQHYGTQMQNKHITLCDGLFTNMEENKQELLHYIFIYIRPKNIWVSYFFLQKVGCVCYFTECMTDYIYNVRSCPQFALKTNISLFGHTRHQSNLYYFK